MILCGVCGVWQHGVCFGLLEEEEVPQVHICEACAQVNTRTHTRTHTHTPALLNHHISLSSLSPPLLQADESGHRQCTDPFLQYLAGLSLQSTCLFRRALLAASEVDKLTPIDLTKRLGEDGQQEVAVVVRGGGSGCVELCVAVEFTLPALICGPGVERTVAQGLLNRLEREGFVSSARGRRVTRKVLKEELARGMGRFMLKRATEAGQEAPRRGTEEEAEKASLPASLCPLAVVEGSCVALMWCVTTGTFCGTDNTGRLVTQPGGAGPAPGKGGWG